VLQCDSSKEVIPHCECNSKYAGKSSESADNFAVSDSDAPGAVLENNCPKCDKKSNEPRKRKYSSSSERNDLSGKPDKQKFVGGTVKTCDIASIAAIDICKPSPSSWVQNFKPRDQVERVRNCTRVSKDLQERIVEEAFQAVVKAKDASSVVTTDQRNWNRGGMLNLLDIM
jgi:hypothetical protein